MSRSLLTAVLLAAALMTACGDDESSSSTTSPTTGPIRTNELFTGTLSVGELQFYSFPTNDSGTTEVTLVSLRPQGAATSTISTVVGLGLGTPAGTGCALSAATTAAPGLTAQVTATTVISTYCVSIADVGNLARPIDFTVRILHP